MKDKLITELLSIEEELQHTIDANIKKKLKRKYNMITKMLKEEE